MMKNNFILIVDFIYKRMYQIFIQLVVVFVVDVDKDYLFVCVFVYYVIFDIYWLDYRNCQIKKMDLFGKNVIIILNLGEVIIQVIEIQYIYM